MPKRPMPQAIVFVTGNAKKLEEAATVTLPASSSQVPEFQVKHILSSGSEELPFEVTSQKAPCTPCTARVLQ